MLVSSIGYFEVFRNSSQDNSVKNQGNKANLSEGFGHYNQKSKYFINNDSNLLKRFIRNLKSLFSRNSSEDSSKYLSLIA